MIHDPIPPGTGQQPLELPHDGPGLEGVAGGGPAPATPHEARIVAEILAERRRQVEKFGHTAEADLAQPVDHLPRRGWHELKGALEYCQFHRLPIARRYLVKTCALLIAAIVRLDMENPNG